MKKIETKLKALLAKNKLLEAEPLFDKLYREYSRERLGYDNLLAYARLKAELKHFPLAEVLASEAIDLNPTDTEAPKALLKIYFDTKQSAKAHRVATRLLESDPQSVEFLGYTLLTKSLMFQITSNEVLDTWHDLIQRDPRYKNDYQMHNAVLGALVGDGRIEDARRHIEQYQLLDVESVWMDMSIPNFYMAAGELDQAIKYLDHAIESGARPNMMRHWNRGLLKLINGDLEGGWSDYKRRWEWEGFPSPVRKLNISKWDGESLEGKKVIISAEQGVGDQIMFGVLINQIINMRLEKLRIEPQHKAVELFKLWYPEAEVVGWQNDPQADKDLEAEFDVHLNMGDLAIHLLRDQQAVGRIQRRLLKGGSVSRDFPGLAQKLEAFDYVIGVNWRSGSIDGARISAYVNVNLVHKLIQSLPSNVAFVVVQYSVSEDERKALSEYENCFVPDADFFNDIVLNGRFCGLCDIVVAAPTMLVPLSALFGTPVLTWCRRASWVDLGTKKYPWFNNVHRIYCDNNADKTALANLIVRKLKTALRLA